MYSKNNFTFILNYTCKLVLPLLILIACTQKTKETPVSIRKKKETKLISPAFNDTLIYGQSIHFKIATIDTNKKIDSIIVHIEKMKLTFTNNTFDMNLPSEKVGNWRVYLKVFLQKNKTESHSVNLIQLPAHPPKQLVAKIINIFPHDPTDYTQGFA